MHPIKILALITLIATASPALAEKGASINTLAQIKKAEGASGAQSSAAALLLLLLAAASQ